MLINAKYMQTTVHCLDTDLLVYYVQYVAGLHHCIQDGRSMRWFPQVYESASYCLKTQLHSNQCIFMSIIFFLLLNLKQTNNCTYKLI